jgi:hypothetical protein
MGIYLPDPVVRELSDLLGFDLSVSIGRWISAAKSEFPCYLEELIDFQGLMGERDASTSQCRILNTSGVFELESASGSKFGGTLITFGHERNVPAI